MVLRSIVDPVTQGALGAALSQCAGNTGNKERMAQATLCGALAGMAPDLDVLIRSSSDPILFLKFHRHFTHSLAFIPVGAAVCAVVFYFALGRRRGWTPKSTYLFSLLGYATHGLLDACTSYGTMLLWPFSDQRVAWSNVAVVDPMVTLPLLVLVVLAWRKRRAAFAIAAASWAVAYLLLGVFARENAEAHAAALAARRGHTPARLEAKPSLGNLLLWKSIYETGGAYHVDAVRLSPFGEPVVYEGTTVRTLDLGRDFPWLDPDSQQARDVERFRWFSDGFVAADPQHPARIGDVRYSMVPNEVRPLWSIALDEDAGPDAHVDFVNDRTRDDATLARFWSMLRGAPLD